MTRGVKRQPQAPADDPVVEAVVDDTLTVVDEVKPEVPGDVQDEVKPEVPFGDDPDDSNDDDVLHIGATVTTASGGRVVYRGMRVDDGAKADAGAVAITVTVPASREKDYERTVTSGITYTLHRNEPLSVADADVDWLVSHAAYLIEEADQKS